MLSLQTSVDFCSYNSCGKKAKYKSRALFRVFFCIRKGRSMGTPTFGGGGVKREREMNVGWYGAEMPEASSLHFF